LLKGTLPNGLAFIGERLSGELAFELHCRPSIALPPWEALVESGLAPYGLEALDILRVEKGYLVSSEFNGQTTAFDLGMSGLIKLGNRCVGSELLDRPSIIARSAEAFDVWVEVSYAADLMASVERA
jgi:hypothetical protein